LFSPRLYRSLVLIAVFGLPACSTNGTSGSSIPLPATDNSIATNVVANRSVEGARAFAANCSSTGAVTEVGNCTNVQIAGTALGPTTAAAQIPGLHPADIQSAYRLPSATAGSGQTIGIVVAGSNPNLASDLAVYRSAFGLPACTTANGCLTQVIGAKTAAAGVNWAHEVSIDVDMASAACPKCMLVVVQVPTNQAADLIAGVNGAIAHGATVVSNSYAIPESPSENAGRWSHPGIPIVAAAGDQAYGTVNWPAAATNSIAVGATTLAASTGTARGWTETAWSGTASGCSTIAAKPAWQTDKGCSKRTVADVAVVGDPQTPVAVYDSYMDNGWIQMGGTSVSTPIVAGAVALAGNGAKLTGASSLYANTSALFGITSGSNGTCTVTYLCTAGSGYNGPAGLGAPNGVTAL
jgi:subtilase family serine protease